MSLDEAAPEAPAAPPLATVEPPRRWWLILTAAAIAATVAVTLTLHLLGQRRALIAGTIAAGVVVLGAVVWRLPQLRRHFAPLRGRSRSRTSRSLTRRGSIMGGRSRRGLSLPKLGRGGPGRSLLSRKRAGHGGAGLGNRRSRGGPGRSLFGRPRGGAGRMGSRAMRLARKTRARGLGGSLSKNRPAGKAARSAARGVRSAWRKTGGRIMPRLSKGRSGLSKGGSSPSTSRSRRSPLPAARRGIRAAWRQARGVTAPKGKNGRQSPPWRKAAGAIAAVPLLPFIAARAGIAQAVTWWRGRSKEQGPAPDDTPAVGAEAPPEPDSQPGRAPTTRQDIAFAAQALGGPSPGRASATPTTGACMSHTDAAAEAVETHIGGFDPQSATEIDQFLHALPQFFERQGGAFARVAERFGGDLPVHHAVSELLRDISATVGGMAEYAQEAWSVLRGQHDRELERIENPRPNEDLWDIRAQ